MPRPIDFNTHSGHTTSATGPQSLLSLPPEILHEITQWVNTGKNLHEAAAHAIRWRQVALIPYRVTHQPSTARAINHARHLDEALIILWKTCIAGQPGAPQLTIARDIRGWITELNSAVVLNTITSIELPDCELKVIPPAINTIRNLIMLHLQNNRITQIAPKAFVNCGALRWLTLSNNRITQIASGTFTGCQVLCGLNLDNNRITQVDPGTFTGCQALESLYLHDNRITQIASGTFTGCQALQRLHLYNNRITQVDPGTFTGCQALQELYLENNRITQVDPETFTGCQALQRLDLANNRITQIAPETFTGCQALQGLNLENNQITQVDPGTFTDCQALQQLNLENNQITQIPPGAFAGCQALQWLYLDNNQITQVDPETFAGCQALRGLRLDNNLITQIAPGTFTGCQALQCLYLGNNQITQITPGTFTGCQALQQLYLYNNQITQIAPGAFIGFQAPEWLWLQLNGNPSLVCTLVLDRGNFMPRFNVFSRYVGKSELAVFYQAFSEGRIAMPDVAKHVNNLKERNLLYEMVYMEARAAAEQEGRTFETHGDHQWGEHHVADDKVLFCRALKRAVQEKFARLSPENRCAVHGEIYRIAREDEGLGPDTPAWDDLNWGENHREDNVLRLIDAMQEL